MVRQFPISDITGTWRIAIIYLMKLGSFTVEFFEHCAAPCAGIYSHPFQHQRGVYRTPD